MSEAQKRGLVVGALVIAVTAAALSFYLSNSGPKEEVVGTMPQLSKEQEQKAAEQAEAGTHEVPKNDAVRTGIDPADIEPNPKGKG